MMPVHFIAVYSFALVLNYLDFHHYCRLQILDIIADKFPFSIINTSLTLLLKTSDPCIFIIAANSITYYC